MCANKRHARQKERPKLVRRAFTIKAIWDEEAKVFFSESDIKGLHIEAKTIDEFEDIVKSEAADLIVANHISESDMANKPMRELVPAILWQRPENTGARA